MESSAAIPVAAAFVVAFIAWALFKSLGNAIPDLTTEITDGEQCLTARLCKDTAEHAPNGHSLFFDWYRI